MSASESQRESQTESGRARVGQSGPERESEWVRESKREQNISMYYNKLKNWGSFVKICYFFCRLRAVSRKNEKNAKRAEFAVNPSLCEAPLAILFKWFFMHASTFFERSIILATMILTITIMMDEDDGDYGDKDSEWMVLTIDNPALFSSPAPVSCHQSSPCAPTVCSR